MITTAHRSMLAAVAAATFASATIAAVSPGLTVAPFDADGIVVQPGQPMAFNPEYTAPGVQGCTTGFLAADDAYLAGKAGGRRYMLTVAHCIDPDWGDGQRVQWESQDRRPMYLTDTNPTLWTGPDRVDVGRFDRFGEALWRDASFVLSDAGTGEFAFDAGVVLLDDAVSVEPMVPELGAPTGMLDTFRTLQADGDDADVMDFYGRGAVVGGTSAGGATVAPGLARRSGTAYGLVADHFLCVAAAAVHFDSGSPMMHHDLAAGLVSGNLSFNSEHWAMGDEDQLCQGGTVSVRLDALLDSFEEATGLRLRLLTERAGPIIR